MAVTALRVMVSQTTGQSFSRAIEYKFSYCPLNADGIAVTSLDFKAEAFVQSDGIGVVFVGFQDDHRVVR